MVSKQFRVLIICSAVFITACLDLDSDGGKKTPNSEAATTAGAAEIANEDSTDTNTDEEVPGNESDAGNETTEETVTVVDRDLAEITQLLEGTRTEQQLLELNENLAGLWLMINEGTETKNWQTLNGNGSVEKTFTRYKLFSLETEHPDLVLLNDEEIAQLVPTAYVSLCTKATASYVVEAEAEEQAEEQEGGEENENLVEEEVIDTDFVPVYPFALNADNGFTIPAQHFLFRGHNVDAVNAVVETHSRLNLGVVNTRWEKANRDGSTEVATAALDTIAIKIRAEMRRPIGTLSIDSLVTLINCLEYTDGTYEAEGIENGEVQTSAGTFTNMGVLNVTDSYRGFAIEAFFTERQTFFDIIISSVGLFHYNESDEEGLYYLFATGPTRFAAEVYSIHPATGKRLVIDYLIEF